MVARSTEPFDAVPYARRYYLVDRTTAGIAASPDVVGAAPSVVVGIA